MCLGCEIISQRMFSEDSKASFRRRCCHFPECRVPRSSFSNRKNAFQIHSPWDQKWKAFVERKICSYFWGILRAIYLHFNCLPKLICHYGFNKWKEPVIFAAISASFPLPFLGKLTLLAILSYFKNSVHVGDREYVYTSAGTHRGPLSY